MPEWKTSPSVRNISRRQRIGVLVLTPAILLGSLFAVYRSTQSHRGLELPKTLEEYRKVLHQPDFGLLFVDFTGSQTPLWPPGKLRSLSDAKRYLWELLDSRKVTIGAQNLTISYALVAGKRVYFGRRWGKITWNEDLQFGGCTNLARRKAMQAMEGIIRTNGGFVFPLNHTNLVVLTADDLIDLGHPVPRGGPHSLDHGMQFLH